MDPQAGPLAATSGDRDDDVDWAAVAVDEPPELACASVAEDGRLTAGEGRGPPLPLTAETRVANCVDASMNSVEASGGDPACDRALVEPGAL